jgi:hypothetical protein
MVPILVFGVIIPALVSFGAGLFVFRPWQERLNSVAWIHLFPVAFALCWFIGTYKISGGMRFPPVAATERYILLGTLLPILSIPILLTGSKGILRWGSLVIVAVLTGLYLFARREQQWGHLGVTLAALAFAGMIATSEFLSRRQPTGIDSILPYLVASGLASVAVGVSGSAKLAQMAGIAPSFICPLFLFAMMDPKRILMLMLPYRWVVPCLLATCVVTSVGDGAVLGLLAVSWLSAALGGFVPRLVKRARLHAALSAFPAAVFGVAAVALAAMKSPPLY